MSTILVDAGDRLMAKERTYKRQVYDGYETEQVKATRPLQLLASKHLIPRQNQPLE
jgi:hypothetical protein